MSATNRPSSSVPTPIVEQDSPPSTKNARTTTTPPAPQEKSTNLDSTIGGVAAVPSKSDEDCPLKIVSRENSPVAVKTPATQPILVDAPPPAPPKPRKTTTPPPLQLRRTPAPLPQPPAPVQNFISQPTPVMGSATQPQPQPPPPHGFLIGSPPGAAAAAASYGFFAAAAAAAAAQQQQQQHAAILLNSCPPLTFVAPPPPQSHRNSPQPQASRAPPQPPPPLNFPPTSILFCRMPGAPMPNVGFGPYTGGSAYHDPTIMAAANWNGHFLVRTATGQLMALAVNNTPNVQTAPAVQRTSLAPPPSNFLPSSSTNHETSRTAPNPPPLANKTTPSKTPSIFPAPSPSSATNRPPTATPILQKTLILPPKDQTRSDAQPPAPPPVIIGCGPPSIYQSSSTAQPQPPPNVEIRSLPAQTTTAPPPVKRRRQATTATANAGVKKPRRSLGAGGLLIAAAAPQPPKTLPQPPAAINFKDKKIKQEIHDMFVDQIRNDCSLMFDAPQIMTHFVDGFVIQESLDPFPISPLIFDDLPPFIQQSAAAAAAAAAGGCGINFDWSAPPRLTPEFAASASSTTTTAPLTSSSSVSSSSATTIQGATAAIQRENTPATTPRSSAKNLLSPTFSTSEKRDFSLISPKKEAFSPAKIAADGSTTTSSSSSAATCRGCSKKLPSPPTTSDGRTTVAGAGWYRKNPDFCSKSCYKSTKKRRTSISTTTSSSNGRKKRRRDKSSPSLPTSDERSAVRPISVPSDSLSPQRRYSTETPAASSSVQRLSGDFPSTSFLEKTPVDWTVDDVQNWLLNLDQKFADLTHIFRQQEIDGQALLLLQEDHLAHQMGLKLGPVLKISAALKMLRN